MTMHSFELHVDAGALPSDVENALDPLYDAGLDDAIIAWRGPEILVQVDRDAPSLAEAIMSAIVQVETVPGIQVSRVQPTDLVSIGEIARRHGKTKAWASMVASGKRGDGTFPRAVVLSHLPEPRWRWDDVQRWFEDGSQPRETELDEAQVIMSVFNSLLELRSLHVTPNDRTTFLPLVRQAELLAG